MVMVVSRLGIKKTMQTVQTPPQLFRTSSTTYYRVRSQVQTATTDSQTTRCSHHNDVPSDNSQACASLLPCMSPPSRHTGTTTSILTSTTTIHKPTSTILQHPLAHPSSTTIPLPNPRPLTSRTPSPSTLYPLNIHVADIAIQTGCVPRPQNFRYVIRNSVDVTFYQDGVISRRD